MLQQDPFFLQMKHISEETTLSIRRNTGEKILGLFQPDFELLKRNIGTGGWAKHKSLCPQRCCFLWEPAERTRKVALTAELALECVTLHLFSCPLFSPGGIGERDLLSSSLAPDLHLACVRLFANRAPPILLGALSCHPGSCGLNRACRWLRHI